MLLDEVRVNPDIREAQTGERGDVRVALGVKPGRDDVDDFDGARLPRARLEKLFLPRPHRS